MWWRQARAVAIETGETLLASTCGVNGGKWNPPQISCVQWWEFVILFLKPDRASGSLLDPTFAPGFSDRQNFKFAWPWQTDCKLSHCLKL